MAPLITLEQARAHLRVEGMLDEQDIVLKTKAAEIMAAEFLNRKVFASQQDLDAAVADGTAGDAPMVCNDLVRAAILLILGHLYSNREDVVTGVSTAALPQGSRALLQPYRVGLGV